MKKFLIPAFFLFCTQAFGQTPVIQQPQRLTNYNASGAIVAAGTFQVVFLQSSVRNGCLIVNASTHTMWVYPGAIASATHDNSVPVAAGLSFNCSTGVGGVLVDAISIDGTTADKYYAGQQ